MGWLVSIVMLAIACVNKDYPLMTIAGVFAMAGGLGEIASAIRNHKITKNEVIEYKNKTED